VPRAEPVKDSGMDVPEAMGSAIAINFQPTGGGKAAITGDFVLAASEVNPVIRALRGNGIEVTALHNHMLDDEPRMFFMHFWANENAEMLAKGLRAALDNVKTAQAGATAPATTQTTAPAPSKLPRTEKECSDQAKKENLTGDALRKSVQACLHPAD
jgi:hypothetical protein